MLSAESSTTAMIQPYGDVFFLLFATLLSYHQKNLNNSEWHLKAYQMIIFGIIGIQNWSGSVNIVIVPEAHRPKQGSNLRPTG